jgi:dihydroorotate dehydrogenase (NAD+) catalytic subunit
MGLPNPGIEQYCQEVMELKNLKTPIIGSVYGANTKEFIELGEKMENCDVSGLELNLSCPHAKSYGLEVGCDPKLVQNIVSSVKDKVSIPVFVKLSPNVTNIVKIAKAAEKGNADAIVAINTVKGMKIDLELGKPILSNKIGGYSGKAIKPIGVRCVYEIAKNVDIPIIGVGGVTTGEDAIEYFMAGASAVQIGSGVYYRGLDVFKKICVEIEELMKSYGYKNLTEIIGVTHK